MQLKNKRKPYKVSFIIYPSKNKIPLGINSFPMILRRKLKIVEEMVGEIRKLRIKKLDKNLDKYIDN